MRLVPISCTLQCHLGFCFHVLRAMHFLEPDVPLPVTPCGMEAEVWSC